MLNCDLLTITDVGIEPIKYAAMIKKTSFMPCGKLMRNKINEKIRFAVSG
jgi:hypothetical protein